MSYFQRYLVRSIPQFSRALGTWISLCGTSLAAASLSLSHIQIDGAGNTLALWECTEDDKHSIQASYLPFNETWSQLILLSTPNTSAIEPKLSMNEKGNAVAAWFVKDPILQNRGLYASMYSPNDGWTPATKLSHDDENVFEFSVKINAINNIVVVWRAFSESFQQEVLSTQSTIAGSAWNTPLVVTTSTAAVQLMTENDSTKK